MKLTDKKIVVIDDKRDEVEKLLKLLDKKGISYNYYFQDANSDNLPDECLKNVRVIFLDFVLGTDGQSEKNKISVYNGYNGLGNLDRYNGLTTPTLSYEKTIYS
jgi:hypothetical protein